MKHSPVAGGRLALVQGDYLYYHYMQDGFNDNVRTKKDQKSYYHDINVYNIIVVMKYYVGRDSYF